MSSILLKLNIHSLNCHHKEFSAYFSILNRQFDYICLSEIWNYNLDFYKNIFSSYRGYVEKAVDSYIGSVAIFIINESKISNRTKDLSIVLYHIVLILTDLTKLEN